MEDRKFKVEDGRIVNRFSGEPIPDDEPIFFFRARDKHALEVLRYYKVVCRDDGCTDWHLGMLRDAIQDFERFKNDHPDRMKQPGVSMGRKKAEA